MRRIVYASAAVLVAVGTALLIAAPAQAAGSSVLTTGSVGGPNVAANDILNASLKSGTQATFTAGSGVVKCSVSSFTAKVLTNPTAPSTATESLTAQTFSSCTVSGIFGVTGVNSVTVNNLAYNASVTSAGVVTLTGGTAGPIAATVKLNTVLGGNPVACTYAANNNKFTGTASNADNSIAFTNQGLTKSTGSNLCPGTSNFSATYAPVKDTTVAGSPSVFVQ